VQIADLHTMISGDTEVELRLGGFTLKMLQGLNQFGHGVRADGDRVTMFVEDVEQLPAIARWVVAQGVALYALTPRRLSLEELFVRIVGKEGVVA
jgi:ABC-2 type transport system ATP-binding protein